MKIWEAVFLAGALSWCLPLSAGIRLGLPRVLDEYVDDLVGEAPREEEGPVVLSSREAVLRYAEPWKLSRAEVVRVVDGDTLVVRIGGTQDKVRYAGANTPESGEACADEATARNAELSAASVLLLQAYADRDRDEYGRLLCYVYDSSGRSIEGALVQEGLARAWRDASMPSAVFTELEGEAREGRAGCLWGG